MATNLDLQAILDKWKELIDEVERTRIKIDMTGTQQNWDYYFGEKGVLVQLFDPSTAATKFIHAECRSESGKPKDDADAEEQGPGQGGAENTGASKRKAKEDDGYDDGQSKKRLKGEPSS